MRGASHLWILLYFLADRQISVVTDCCAAGSALPVNSAWTPYAIIQQPLAP